MRLQEYLTGIKEMPDDKADLIASYFKSVNLEKGEMLIQEGKTSKKSYFLESGIIRCFIVDLEGNEVTTRFFAAPDFLNDFLSFFEQKPSEENYELLTDCKLHGITFDDVQYCFHNISEFREWGRMLLTLNYVRINRKIIAFHKETAKERYVNFLNDYPEIVNQVPLHIVASYLGVTKHSLSRIRKEIV